MTVDPRARRRLRQYRDARTRSGPARDALWSRIERSVDARAHDVDLDPAAPAPRRAAAWLVAVLGSATVAALAVGVAPHLRESPPPIAASAPEAPAHVSTQPAAHRAAPRAISEPSPAAVAPEPRPTARRPTTTRPSRPAPAPAPTPNEADVLREEMTLIARARAALRSHDTAGALSLLETHLRRYPEGQMREDRAALRIEALCAVDKQRQAAIEFQRFTRAFPASAHASRLAQLCPTDESIP